MSQSQSQATTPTRSALLNNATSFCNAFASGTASPSDILSHFTSDDAKILVHEHGLPQLAPFLGRTFRGADGLRQYLSVISECLSYENMRFAEYIVDAEARKVSVRGQARFTWTSTGQSWDEVFTYVLGVTARQRCRATRSGQIQGLRGWRVGGNCDCYGRGERLLS